MKAITRIGVVLAVLVVIPVALITLSDSRQRGVQMIFSPNGVALPSGFIDEVIATAALPTALAFTPDGRMLVTTQDGLVYIFQNGEDVPLPALDLHAVVCTERERGMTGIAVDPDFAVNHHIFLYYTFDKFGGCDIMTPRAPVNRVSRFTLTSANMIDPASELVLVDNISSYGGSHNAGDLKFGGDGYLYVSVGDGGRDYLGRSETSRENQAARDRNVLLGKILRITSTGEIPASNPFQGVDSARCAQTGRTDPGKICQETFAWGLRNPFRIAFDPNAAALRLFINDTGQDTWEEINLGVAGADYGWNVREGHCARGSTTDCGAPPDGMTNPLYDYGHDECAALTGGAFVPRGIWPAPYDGAYLFADFLCGSIFRLIPDDDGFTRELFLTGLGPGSITTLQFGPYAGTQALYYTTFSNGGEVHRVVYVGSSST